MLTFYHAPMSRSVSIRWLIEELGVDYDLVHIDIRAETGPPEDYRTIQPNKKVPAIEHDGVVVTERAAISIHLADAFPQAGLAPAPGDPLRGPYLSALVYCDAVMDPCIAARAHGLSYVSNDYSFGLFDDMVANLERRLSKQAYFVGDRFSAADVQIATAIDYATGILKVLPDLPVFRDYVARCKDRPAYKVTMEKDTALARTVPALRHWFDAG